MMLRAVSVISTESKALELLVAARRDVFKLFRVSTYGTTALHTSQTVLTGTESRAASPEAVSPGTSPAPLPPPQPPPQPPQSRRVWTTVAGALVLTASLGGVYFYRKFNEDEGGLKKKGVDGEAAATAGGGSGAVAQAPIPASGAALPRHVHYLLVGAGTASFAAMRAIRSARPDAQVLIVGDELQLPYMRPPLSKELWREPRLPGPKDDLDSLTFRQWNGRRRTVTYEPNSFYTPVEELEKRAGGASVARGWRVARLDVEKHEAELHAPGSEPVVVRYDKCLVATGVRPRRADALRDAAAAGRALTLRGVRDVTLLAEALERPHVRRVAVLGGGFLASELSAALAERLRDSAREVVQVFREEAPMAAVLPSYLAAESARRLTEIGVRLQPAAEVRSCALQGEGVRLRLASGEDVDADLVVECLGSEIDDEFAHASRLETHPDLGGLLVNAELQARTDVYAAGDVACFYDVALGRRRVEHHDHAVVSGRLAGQNMAALDPPKHYTHQSMFWSDLGPQLGYEAIGIVDSRLPTVGVFSAEAVAEAATGAAAARAAGDEAPAAVPQDAASRRYERGVVFYLRGRRVVGVLLWNLFNRMHVARAVLTQGEFDDLFEVAKLFSLHEED